MVKVWLTLLIGQANIPQLHWSLGSPIWCYNPPITHTLAYDHPFLPSGYFSFWFKCSHRDCSLLQVAVKNLSVADLQAFPANI